ncbi:hypothetical protein TREES_T100010401 [Tupaia chinensis]|uniref:Uncharacterized protein n=1 Tax=Tupaia chinensis TaxID=246437 RepID=L9LCL2_TUPCH|nr:hypothetical protein TREES_T100010401 [Tupaia chinensis]
MACLLGRAGDILVLGNGHSCPPTSCLSTVTMPSCPLLIRKDNSAVPLRCVRGGPELVQADGTVPLRCVRGGPEPVQANGTVPLHCRPGRSPPVQADGTVPLRCVRGGPEPVQADGTVPLHCPQPLRQKPQDGEAHRPQRLPDVFSVPGQTRTKLQNQELGAWSENEGHGGLQEERRRHSTAPGPLPSLR